MEGILSPLALLLPDALRALPHLNSETMLADQYKSPCSNSALALGDAAVGRNQVNGPSRVP